MSGILENKRIFIVEDNMMNIAVYGALLRNTGAVVIQDPWTTNSVQTLIRKLPVDIILMDLMLRYDVSGYDLFKEIRTYPEMRDIPVLAVSASDAGIEIPKAKAAGMNGFIGKPINPVKFPQQILACIQGEQVWYTEDTLAGA